jgi:AcrR family transcriptional regulator
MRPGDTAEDRLARESIAAALKAKRSELMRSQLEDVALRLFEARGFGEVTVEDVAAAAQISVRTFYRYFPSKELLLQVRIDRRSTALQAALATRPDNEAILTSLRAALTVATSAEDPEDVRRWIEVVAGNPELIRGVLGGIQLKIQSVIAEFLAGRMDRPDDVFAAEVLAGAVGGAVQAALRYWFQRGGDLAATIANSIDTLEHLGGAPAPFGLDVDEPGPHH